MNKIFRIVFNRTTGRWTVASEVAKGHTKPGGARTVASGVVLTGVIGVLAGASSPSFASVIVNGDPQEGTVGCELITDGGSTTWTASTSAGACLVTSGTSASGQGNPGKRAIFYSSDKTNGNEDSLNVGGYMDVWKTATFHGGIAMDGQKITGLANGLIAAGSTEAINGGQLFSSNQAIAAAFGTTLNASGNVNAPSYTLANANSIAGTSGAATDVGSGFTKVDAALGKLNTTVNNITTGSGIKYFHANSTLADSQAVGTDSIAVGPAASTSQTGDVAIGRNAQTQVGGNPGSIAIGDGATAYGNNGISGGANVAIGVGSVAGRSDASTSQGLAVGSHTSATNWATTAVGVKTTATGIYASALGSQATANGDQATAVGAFAHADVANATALGQGASASATNSVALGRNSQATRADTVSVGAAGAERQVVNVAKGTADTDAVNVSQLKGVTTALGGGAAVNADGTIKAPTYALTNANTIGGTSGAATDVGGGFTKVDAALGKLDTTVNTIANGGGIKYFHANSVLADSVAGGTDSVAIGGGSATNGSGIGAVAIGRNAQANYSGVVAIGDGASTSSAASTPNQIAIGTGATTGSGNALAMGGGATATGGSSIALGNTSSAAANSAIAMGRTASAGATNAIALGDSANASAANSIALGAGSTTTANLTTAGYNPGSAALSGTASAANGEVSVGKAGSERRLTNLAAGSAATDAVNVSQLQAEDATVDKLGADAAARLGGGAAYTATTGAISAPSYTLANANTIGGTSGAATDVGGGFAKVDAALGALNTTANKGWNLSADGGATSQNIAPGATAKFAAGTNATVSRSGDTITYGVVANPTFAGMVTASGGLTVGAGQTVSMGGNKVTNVAAGTAATDAVNKSQLDAVATTAGTGWNMQANGGTADKIAPGESVNFADGSNTTVAYDATTNKLQVNVSANPTFTTVTTGSSKLDTTGLTITGGPSVTTSGINAGSKVISNVANGVAGTDAVNYSQLSATNANVTSVTNTVNNITNGNGIKYFHANSTLADSQAVGSESVAVGGNANAAGGGAIAMGQAASAATTGSIGLGQNAAATGAASISIGQNALQSATANNSIAIGGSSKSGDKSVSLGNGAETNLSTWAVAVGTNAHVTGAWGTALGGGTTVAGDYGVTVGVNSSASATNATAIGAAANASAANSIALGAGSTTTANLTTAGYNPGSAALSGTASAANGEVSVGKAGSERRLTNLAAGSAATDAVNVSQLQAEDATVDKLGADAAARLGGGAAYTATTGAISAPSYTLANANTIGGTSGAATDVGGGFAKVDAALGALNTTANKGWNLSADGGATSQNIAPGATAKFAAGTNATVSRSGDTITYGVVANPTFAGMVTASGGLTVGAGQTVSMGGNKVTNVAAGTAATDAVNKSQLDAVATTAGTGWNMQANSGTADKIAPGESVNFADGSNTTVVYDATTNKMQVNVSANPTFTSVTTGSSKLDTTGLVITGGPSVTTSGINAGSKVISNVANGVASTDAVNVGQLASATSSLSNSPITFAGNSGANVARKLGETLAIKGAASTAGTYSGGNLRTVTDPATGAINLEMADSPTFGAVTVNAGGTGKITGVTDGNIASGSKEAVNGGQLYTTNQAVAGNTTSISNLQTTVNNISSGTVGLVQQSAAGANLTVGKDTDGAAVDFAGTNGARKLINVADGTVAANSKDAVNGGQLSATNDRVTAAEGNITNLQGDVTSLDQRVTTNEGDISNLDNRVTNVEGSVTNLTTQINSGEVGLVQQSAAGANLTVGKDTDGAAVDFAGTAGARKLINVADGTVAAGSQEAVNGGQLYGVSTSVATALGGGSTVDANGNVTAPSYSLDGGTATASNVGDAISNLDGRTTTNTQDIATINTTLGSMGSTLADAVMYDSSAHDSVTFGNAGTPVQLSNVKAGVASTDAVNVSQLKPVVDAMGGGASIDPTTGEVTGPSYAVTNADGSTSTVNTVGDAITNIDGRTYANTTQITNLSEQINSGTVGLVQQSAAGANLTVGKDTDGAAVDFAGTAGARKLINVADGTVAAGSQEAVNGGQLYGVSTSVATALGGGSTVDANGNVTAPSYSLDGGTATASNVGDAISNLDGRTTTNTQDIATINTTLGSMGSTLADAVMYDSSAHDSVTFGNAGTPVQLSNVKAGVASTDAVNVSQLKPVVDAMGGGASIDPTTGAVTGPSYTVVNNDGTTSTSTTVGGAVTNLNTNITNLSEQINSGTVGLVQQAAAGANLTVGKDTDGAAVDFADNTGTARTLSNVKAGTAASDAVNVSQLTAALGGTVNSDGTVIPPSYDVHNADGSTTNVTNVGDAITNLDGRVYTNTTDIAQLQQDALQWNDAEGAYDASHGTASPNRIANVAVGTKATDAVNVSQLTAALGGTVNSDGTVIPPSYDVHNADGSTTNVTNVGDAITNLDGRVYANTTDIVQLQQDALQWNDTLGAYDASHGTGTAQKIANVDDGTVTANSKDAVNGGQLSATNDRVTAAEGNITTLQGDVTSLDQRVTTSEGDISNLDSRVTTNEGDISNLDNRVTTNEGDISNLDSRVTTNEGDITTLNTNVSNLDGRVTNVEGSVTNLTTQINNGEVGLVKYDDASSVVTVASDKGGSTVDFRNSAGAARRLKGVAAGADNEDAVNVSQLKSVVDGMGGGASIDPTTGEVTGPTYYVTNADGSTSEVHNMGDAVTNLDGRVYNNTTQITNLSQQISSGTVGLVQQAAPGQKLTVGKDTDGSEVSFANVNGEARKLTDVADGTVAAGSKDAVNGGQLHAVSQSMADAMGGGSTVNSDGTISAPTYTVTNADGSKTDVHNIGDAVTNIDGRVYQNTQDIANNTTQINHLTTQINNGEVGLVKQDATTQEVTVAKASGGKTVNFAGTDGDRTLTGVASGKADNDAVNVGQLKAAGIVDGNGQAKAVVAYDGADKASVTMGGEGASKPVAIHNVADGVADHDAVNVAQLNDRLTRSNTEVVTQANSYTDQRIDDVWGGVNKVANELVRQDRRISQVGAMSMAEAQMTSNAAAASVGNPNGAWAVGLGSQEGHGAISAGYAKPIGQKSRISFGAAFSGHDQSIGIGFGRAL